MTKLITALFAAAVLSSAAYAAAPDKMTFDAKSGKVEFDHKAHAKQGCKSCHEGAPGKIADFSKDKAHALCKGCHEKQAKGPTKCAECHKKG